MSTRRWTVRRFFIISMALLLIVAFVSTAYADRTVKAAKAGFKRVRETYISAKKELNDAQLDALMTVGKAEKQEAVKRVWNARRTLKKTKAAYKKALNVLHKAEIARDAKIDRSPWK